jgi:hypothetical protein
MRFASSCSGIEWNGMNDIFGTDATALRLGNSLIRIPRVAEAATLGWRAEPRCG